MLTNPGSDKASGDAAAAAPLPPAPRTPRLDTADRVRGELARCYRRAAHGLIDWPTACRAGYLLSLLHRMLVDGALDALADRIAALEARGP